uniref:Uncharacterized protein n=1 Tax=Arundo donax TaxID=35708 RepID=A0A0A9AAD6_ARUDO
MALYFFLPF